MTKKKILILYTSIGLGHKSIAENISYYLSSAGYEVREADILKVQSGWLVKLGTLLHGFINHHFPFIWSGLYQSDLVTKVVKALRATVASGNNKATVKLIDDFQPDLILTTQTTASGVIASLKQQDKFHGQFVIAFSDYHLHPLWLYDEADLYLANTSEQKSEMIKLGVAEDKIVVCGITLRPAELVDALDVKQRIGLSTEKAVLIVSGSLGIGLPSSAILELARKISREAPGTGVIVVCGKNEKLYRVLSSHQSDRFKVIGYYKPLTELYQVADVILTKPGGLSIAEMAQLHKKPIITHWLPGQEELNYDYLVTHNIVHPMPKPNHPNFIAMAVAQELKLGEQKPHSSEPEIIAKSKDGKVLIEAINKVFHSV